MSGEEGWTLHYVTPGASSYGSFVKSVSVCRRRCHGDIVQGRGWDFSCVAVPGSCYSQSQPAWLSNKCPKHDRIYDEREFHNFSAFLVKTATRLGVICWNNLSSYDLLRKKMCELIFFFFTCPWQGGGRMTELRIMLDGQVRRNIIKNKRKRI